MQKLHRRTVVDDEGDCDPFRRSVGFDENLTAVECFGDIVDDERNVRHGLDEVGEWAVRLETQPLDSKRVGVETHYVH